MTRVTYLFGAGITQSELDFAGLNVQLLPSQIKDGVHKQLGHAHKTIRDLISNDLSTPSVDIEHLISLYETTGTLSDMKAARFLRKAYMTEIVGRLRPLDEKGKPYSPKLIAALFELHKQHANVLGEELVGVLTLNYDDFAERALKLTDTDFSFGFKLGGNANIGIGSVLTLLKLHGSFNWTNAFPPRVNSRAKVSDESCLWIPPGVEKKRDKYPFSILWGKAKEALDCNVLRVIGCSLSRNDWHLISLLHSGKRIQKFSMELIDFSNVGNRKEQEFPYLGISKILDISGFRIYLSDQTGLRGAELESFADSQNSKTFNCFHEWLKFKKSVLESRDKSTFKNSTYLRDI